MPLGILAKASFDGLAAVPYSYTILRTLPWIALVYLLKMYFGGARNRSERMMHSKVVMMTVSCDPFSTLGITLTDPC